ncbi:unnamed protein product, partial [Callosobruchus maculatus]
MPNMKISANQKATLIELLKDKTDLISGKFGPHFSHATAKDEWEAIATTLNSMPGCQKTWKMWRSTWQHIRSRTKLKQSEDLRNRRATGGGPETVTLKEIDQNILSMIKPVMVEGHNITGPSVRNISIESVNDGNDDVIINDNKSVISDGENSRTPIHVRKIPQRPHGNFKKNFDAASAYKQSLDRKNDIKERYYERKLALLERNA